MRRNLSTENLLDEFVHEVNKYGKEMRSYNRWLEDDRSLRVYVRRSVRSLGHGDLRRIVWMLDIGSVAAEPEGNGRFTAFLEYVETAKPFDGIFVESVQTIRFADFFRTRGYHEIDSEVIPSFYRLWDEVR